MFVEHLLNETFNTIGFTAFMLGKENDIFNFNHKAIYQDMTQPLSHYYIHSSHNT